MAKTRRRKRSPRSTSTKRIPRLNVPPESYRSLTLSITQINRFSSYIAIGLNVWVVIDFERLMREGRGALITSWIIFFSLAAIKVSLQISTMKLFAAVPLNRNIHQKFRRRAVWLLTLSTFIIINAAIPMLYVYGYVTRFSSWLQSWFPGKPQLGSKVSVGLAFILGAVISGVIGNFAYDVLKFLLRKKLR